jgi:hypothetical protein
MHSISRRIALVFFSSLLAVYPGSVFSEAYAKYESGANWVVLMTTPCSGDASGQLRMLGANLGGKFREGCYLINNLGNPVVRWFGGGIEELDGSIFRLEKPVSKLEPKSSPTPDGKAQNIYFGKNWNHIKPLYVVEDSGNPKCVQNEWGMFASPWGNSRAPLEEKQIVSKDNRSMRLVAKFEDGSASFIDYYKTLQDCKLAIKAAK